MVVGGGWLLIGGWHPAANWDVRSDAVREKPTMMEHCEPLSVGLVGGEWGMGGLTSRPIKRCASGPRGGGWGVLVGYRLQTPSGLCDSLAIKWNSAGDAANLSDRHPASQLPVSPLPQPPPQEDTPTQWHPGRDASGPPARRSSHVCSPAAGGFLFRGPPGQNSDV